MPPVTADQIGKRYDILIATRDGSTLPCQDHRGATQQISQVAYMLSTTKPSSESTEIQRKDRLTQLASAQVIDREFDAWPQVEQGTWVDGMGQRVFSGQGEAVGTVSNKSTAYWDGLGLLWPVTDYLPVRGVRATADQNEGGALMKTVGVGTAGGFIGNFSPNLSTFVYMYQQVNAPQNNIMIIQGDGSKTTITNPGGIAAGSLPAVDYIMAFDTIFYLYQSAGSLVLATINGSGTVTNQVTIASATLLPLSNVGALAAGAVGNKLYVAFGWAPAVGSAPANIRLIDVSSGSFTSTATDVPLSSAAAVALPQYQQIVFLGDNLIVGAYNYHETVLLQFNIPSQTWSTLARFPNTNALYMCSIAGSLFVLAANDTAVLNEPNSVDMYLVQGGGVQHIGPLQITGQNGLSSFITGEGFPTAYGPYAIFPIYYYDGTSTHVAVHAYDVLRGRLFKLDDLSGYGQFLGNVHGPRMATFSSMKHPFSGGTGLAAQWGVAVPVLSQNGSAQDTTNVQRLLFGCSNGGFNPFQQPGTQITSSLIDFTSAQNKLYRQVVVSFTPLPNNAACTVQLDVWLDQDPGGLNAAPDFTTGAVAAGVNGGVAGQKQLKLVINAVARKLVYRVTIASGTSGTTMVGASKLISVTVQVATGWALDYVLPIEYVVSTNDGQDCWQTQAPVDSFVAHAFVKQLWRLKGGECVITLPTGENYNALLQLVSVESMKHVVPQGTADGSLQKSVLLEIKIREDV